MKKKKTIIYSDTINILNSVCKYYRNSGTYLLTLDNYNT